LTNGAVKFFGPHQRFISSGFVHAFHTLALGALKTRTILRGFAAGFEEAFFVITFFTCAYTGLKAGMI
jgi:hypothetical protein